MVYASNKRLEKTFYHSIVTVNKMVIQLITKMGSTLQISTVYTVLVKMMTHLRSPFFIQAIEEYIPIKTFRRLNRKHFAVHQKPENNHYKILHHSSCWSGNHLGIPQEQSYLLSVHTICYICVHLPCFIALIIFTQPRYLTYYFLLLYIDH